MNICKYTFDTHHCLSSIIYVVFVSLSLLPILSLLHLVLFSPCPCVWRACMAIGLCCLSACVSGSSFCRETACLHLQPASVLF